jgi:DNA-binding NarL/FixJ family response regulator
MPALPSTLTWTHFSAAGTREIRGRCASLLPMIVADDHEAVRKGVCAILGTRLDIEVCREAANGQESDGESARLKTRVNYSRYYMPILTGLDAARVIRLTFPELPILLLTMHEGKLIIEDARKTGIDGFVCMSDDSARLLAAVDAVLRNQPFFPKID